MSHSPPLGGCVWLVWVQQKERVWYTSHYGLVLHYQQKWASYVSVNQR